MTRASWDEYFLGIAAEVSKRATCPRAHVGVVLVVDKQIIGTGYNGSVRGMPHCDDVGCDLVNGRCQRTIHAEINALSQAARKNGGVDGATAYLTHFPCGGCFKALVNAGIVRVVYGEIRYVDALVISTAAALKIPLVGPAFEEIGHKSETPAPGLAERGFRTEQGATSEVSPTSGRG